MNMPRYTKVLNLGSFGTQEALKGEVAVQEKVDGSQFRFGVDDDGALRIGTRRTELIEGVEIGMFQKGYDYVKSIESKIRELEGSNIWFFCEYLYRPKHNTLAYESVPQNCIVLFDATIGGGFVDRGNLERIAEHIGVDVIPEFFRGNGTTVDSLKEYHARESYLGKELVEGVVIKNYNMNINIGGQLFPLFTKLVRDEFREKHSKNPDHKPRKAGVDEYIMSFRNENRWTKAVQHMRDDGKLAEEPRDIGELIKRVHKDIEEEEMENIKADFYAMFIKDIKRMASSGLPEWYKDRLLETVK